MDTPMRDGNQPDDGDVLQPYPMWRGKACCIAELDCSAIFLS